MKKSFLLFFILFCLNISLYSKELKKVTLQLSWFDQFQFAGYYMAKEKGFYKELGLDVDIRPFNFGIDVASLVDEKKADFGVGRETLILERVAGKKIVALYALFQSSPLILISTEKSGITKIEDFKNKRIMTTIDDASEVSIKAMIISKKLKINNLNFIKHTHNIDDLINEKTDLISAYTSKAPFELQEKKVAYNIFSPSDYGFDMYSDFLFTNEDLVKNSMDEVIAFKKASLKGWVYAYNHIDEAVDLIYEKYNTQNLSKKALKFEALQLKKLSYKDDKPLGNIEKSKIQRIYDLYNVMGLVFKPIDLKKFVLYEKNEQTMFLTQKEKSYLKDNSIVKMCVAPNEKPYSFIENNELKGFIADYFKKIGQMSGLNFKLVKTDTFLQSLEFLKNGKCDILSSIKDTYKRREYINFTRPFAKVPFVLISKSDFPYVDILEVLENKRIGLIPNYAISKEIKKRYPQLDFVFVKNSDDGINKILNGEIDGQIEFLYKALYKLYEKNNQNLKISNKLDISLDTSIGVRKDKPILYSILNRAVGEIGKKEKDDIIKKWITVEYKENLNFKYMWEVIVGILILFFVLLYRQKLLNEMNKSLNEKVKEKTEELVKINNNLEIKIKEELEKNLNKDKLLERQAKMAAMGEMLENIAHQWRQPLSVISTGASGIKVKKDLNILDDEFLMENLDLIIHSSKYLSHTIDDFRFFFKPNKEKVNFYVGDCFEKTLNIISSKFNEKNIKIVKNIENVNIVSYETELIQVFINILNNAKEALEVTNIKDKIIFVDVKNMKDRLVIKIKDNAGGIDENIIDKVFEPYFTTKHRSQGTGIGLYMCDQIVSKHMNGVMEVFNKDFVFDGTNYRGAEFTIILYRE